MSFDLRVRNGIVRILKPNGETAGSGFVLTPDGLIATCSHVVQSNESQKRGEPKPEKTTIVFRATGESREAQIEPNWWRSSHKGEDVAILRVNGCLPARVKPLPLGSSKGTSNHPFGTFGFPKLNSKEGIWGDGHILGETEIQDVPVLQLSSNQVTPGFSGAPVADRLRQRVVGMVTSIIPPDEYGRQGVTAFSTPIETLREICSVLKLSDVCPYRNLDAFTEADADFFSGRDSVIDMLVSSLRKEPRFLAVFGPSGCGKSSVVQAGLIPRLRKGEVLGSVRGRILVTRPTDSSFEQQVANLSQSTEYVALIIDQFEEILVPTYPEVLREKMIVQLTDALENSPRISLIIVMRNDFYSLFVQQERLAQWKNGRLIDISPTVKREEVVDMIEKPASIVGWDFEDKGLVNTIANEALDTMLRESKDVGSSTILPLLEFALTQLWEQRQDGELTYEAYRRIGGVTGALTQWADYAYYSKKEQQPLIRHIFTALVHLGNKEENIPDTLKRSQLTSLVRNKDEEADVYKVVQRLVDLRLLVKSQEPKNKEGTVEIIHYALLREWELLKKWIDEDRTFFEWRQKLDNRVQDWSKTDTGNPHKNEANKLLKGRELDDAIDQLSNRKEDLSQLAQDFIKASRKHQHKERNKRRFLISAIVAVLLLFSGITGIFGWQAQMNFLQSQIELRTARSQALAANAQNYMLKNQFDLALLLSVKAYQTDNNFVTRDTLLTALEQSSHISKILHNYSDFVFSSDSRTLLSSRPDGTITLWDLATGRSHSLLIPIPKDCQGVRLDPDGKKAVSLCPYGVGLWDIKTGRQLAKLPLKEIDGRIILTFSPDGHLLAAYDGNGNIVVWNLDSGKPSVSPLSAYDPYAANMYMQAMPTVFSPDGKLLASSLCWNLPAFSQCSGPNISVGKREDQQIDQQIFIWDVASGKRISTFTSHQFGVMSLAFSPNGQLLATGGLNGTIVLWNMQTKQPLGSPLVGHTGHVQSLAFSPDGKTLVSGSTDKTVRFWDVATQQNSGDPWLGHQGSVSAVLFSPDGQRLVSGSSDNTLIIWNLTLDSPIRQQVCSRIEGLVPTDLDSSGHLLASTLYERQHNDQITVLCDVATGTYISLPTTLPVRDLAFSPDGRTLATYSNEAATITLWDVATKKPLATFKNPDNSTIATTRIMFSPDGRIILASYNEDTTITLWDVATKKPPMTMTFKSADNKSLPPQIMFSPDGRVVASYGNGTAITLWDTTTGQFIRQLRSYGTVKTMAFSSDGKAIASGGTDKAITLWDVATGERIGQSLRDNSSGIYPLVFIPNGRTLVSMSDDGTIILWDRAEQKLISRLPMKSTGDVEFPPDVELSPDGKLLAVASKDGSIIIWDMTSQELFTHPLRPFGPDLALYPYLSNFIGQIRFGSNGQLVAMNLYGRERATIKVTLWNINIALWIAHACSVANRNLTRAEWEQFVGDEPFGKVCPNHSS